MDSLISAILSLPEHVANAIFPFLSGMVGGIFSAILARKNSKMAHNFSALITLTQSPSQASAYAAVYKFLALHPGREVIGTAEVRKEEGLEEQLIIMLGTYQFIAVAASGGLVDRDLIIRDFYASMEMLVRRFRPFIDEYRGALKRQQAWSDLIAFVDDGASRYKNLNKSWREWLSVWR